MNRVEKLHPTLPLFGLRRGELAALYAPGAIARVSADALDEIVEAVRRRAEPCSRLGPTLRGMISSAEASAAEWRAMASAPKRLECLTVYLGNACTMGCAYCYAAAQAGFPRPRGPGEASSVPLEAVLAAARLVARSCAERSTPFNVALHGGGEPTLHWELLRAIVEGLKRVARDFGLELRSHIATNGYMSVEKAEWLAANLSSICLSCDGPPEIQDRQRPTREGSPGSPVLERTATVFAGAAASFETRATITRETMGEQTRIADYLIGVMGARKLRFEPLYALEGTRVDPFRPEEARDYSKAFLEAQCHAARAGAELSYSGVDLSRLHGSFCESARDVLHLRPDGSISSCFFSVEDGHPSSSGIRIGQYDPSTDDITIEDEAWSESRARAFSIPSRCRSCLAAYHCSRSCPERCVATPPGRGGAAASFRCELNRILAEVWILDTAGKIGEGPAREAAGGPAFSAPGPDDAPLEPFLDLDDPDIDAAAITEQWRAARAYFRSETRSLPSPIWARRGFDRHGKGAWHLVEEAAKKTSRASPLSMYVHVPFCDRRCAFCDCYSLPERGPGGSARSGTGERTRRYADCLVEEAAAWANTGAFGERPVTTVHFGGGSPILLGKEGLGRILAELKAAYRITEGTELALESTSSHLTVSSLSWLRELGFSRLHVGAQCLDDEVRGTLGRKETAARVLEKLAMALDAGFILSVDLIYGLPGLSPKSFSSGIHRLVEAEIHGFSFYQLQESKRNRRFISRGFPEGRDSLGDYFAFQSAESIMTMNGYAKNHLCHYSRPPDANLYYGHRVRGEDLLSLGASADGIIAFCAYRHPTLDAYLGRSESRYPTLEGAVIETGRERETRTAIDQLLCARVSEEALKLSGLGERVAEWESRRLIERAPPRAGERSGAAGYRLTANGSWFIGEMLEKAYGPD